MGWLCTMYGGKEKCIQGFGGASSMRGHGGKQGRSWKDNIKMVLKEIQWGRRRLDSSGSG